MALIRYVTPYSLDGNLADAMNYEISISPQGSFVCFMDRDTIILDGKYGHRINDIIAKNGVAFYTCMTNRTNCAWQRLKLITNEDQHLKNDISHHTMLANNLLSVIGGEVEDHTHGQLWSGHFMVCPVDLWTPLALRGLLGVDNEIHRLARDNGHRVLLMTGVYLFHWYSGYDGDGGHQKRDKSHLI